MLKRMLIFNVTVFFLLLAAGGCSGSRRTSVTGELGAITRSGRIRPGEGPGWRLTMPVVHRNRKPKAATWPAALESLFRAAPEAVAAMDVSGNVLAALGLAETLGTWVVPDLSSTQNVVFEFDGLATQVIVKGLQQEETADGRVLTSVDAVEVHAAERIQTLDEP